MFTELGLNVARQPDNGANPRPDNRSGWLDGETPDVVEAFLDTPAEAEAAGIEVRLWDPATQLRFRTQGRACRRGPTARRTAGRSRPRDAVPSIDGTGSHGAPRRAQRARPLPPHAHGQRAAGPARRARRQAGPAAVLEQLPRPGRPPARARGGGRRGDALGRRRRGVAAGVRHDDGPPAPRGAPGRVRGHARPRCSSARATWRTSASSARWRARATVVFSDELNHASIVDGCRLARRRDVRLPPRRRRAPRLGPAQRRRPRRADRHRLGVLDGRRRRAAGRDRRARAPPRRARRRRRGARHRLPRARAAAARCAEAGARGRGRRRRRHARQGARLLRRVRGVRPRDGALPASTPRARSSSRPRRRRRPRPAALAALELLERAAASASSACRPTPTRCATSWPREGFDVAGSTTQIVPLVVGDAALAMRICELAIERGVFAQAIRPPTVPEGTSRLRLAVMASHTRDELREAARVLGRAALQAASGPAPACRVAARRRATRPVRRRDRSARR